MPLDHPRETILCFHTMRLDLEIDKGPVNNYGEGEPRATKLEKYVSETVCALIFCGPLQHG